MEIALIENNNIIKIGHYKELFPDTSFPSTGPNNFFMAEHSALKVTVWKPYDKKTQKLVNCEPYIEDFQVFTVRVDDKTEEDLALDFQFASIEIINKRNKLLELSDWTQVLDTPVNRDSWVLYRQELRDITKQEQFPFNVIWPTKP